MKKFKYLAVAALATMSLLVASCSTKDNGETDVFTEEQARQTAENFVKNSPTFTFDGMDDTLVLAETLYPDIPNAWQFVYKFDSRQSGYGDREGQMLLQVITPHEAIITIENGTVKSALMDGKWNMMTQELIEGESDEEADRQLAEIFLRNSPTFVFDGIEETLELVSAGVYTSKTISSETPVSSESGGREFMFRFESAHAGYGDRTDMIVAEVITPHEAVIAVEDGEVKRAIMDGKWDMFRQRIIEDEEVSISPAPIHQVEVYHMESYPVQIGVQIEYGLRDGCTSLHDVVVTRDGDTVTIEITTQRPIDAICDMAYRFGQEYINLGSDFTEGTTYTLKVNDYTTEFDY